MSTTDDRTITERRHQLVEQLNSYADPADDWQQRMLDQLHAELVAGIVLLRTCTAGADARERMRDAVSCLDAAVDAVGDAQAAWAPGLEVRPTPTVGEQLARAQLDPAVSTVRTPAWRAGLADDELPTGLPVEAHEPIRRPDTGITREALAEALAQPLDHDVLAGRCVHGRTVASRRDNPCPAFTSLSSTGCEVEL